MSEIESLFKLTPEFIENAKVLVVDDDDLVTKSLSSFLSLEVDIEPITFNESPRAADYLEHNKIDMIISDFLMPELDGIQLLKKARQLQPAVPRVLLTGYADKENAIRAINDVQVFQYIEKPWENEMLQRVVLNGLERLLLIRTLTEKMDELGRTQKDLMGLRNALVRTFA